MVRFRLALPTKSPIPWNRRKEKPYTQKERKQREAQGRRTSAKREPTTWANETAANAERPTPNQSHTRRNIEDERDNRHTGRPKPTPTARANNDKGNQTSANAAQPSPTARKTLSRKAHAPGPFVGNSSVFTGAPRPLCVCVWGGLGLVGGPILRAPPDKPPRNPAHPFSPRRPRAPILRYPGPRPVAKRFALYATALSPYRWSAVCILPEPMQIRRPLNLSPRRFLMRFRSRRYVGRGRLLGCHRDSSSEKDRRRITEGKIKNCAVRKMAHAPVRYFTGFGNKIRALSKAKILGR